MKKELRQLEELAKRYAKEHIDACRNWPHGGIADFWRSEEGYLCIQYEDGSRWNYTESAGEVTWR